MILKKHVDYLNYYQPKEGDAADTKSQTLAVDLCLAALTGEGVYNLGQVVSNPILKVLEETPQAWLVELLVRRASRATWWGGAGPRDAKEWRAGRGMSHPATAPGQGPEPGSSPCGNGRGDKGNRWYTMYRRLTLSQNGLSQNGYG